MHGRSARLTLREFTLADIEALYALESIPDVARYQTWAPRTRAEAEKTVQASIEEAAAVPRVIVEQAVFITAPSPFIGRVGGHIDGEKRTAEVWFSFMPSARGHGYATEAIEALIGMLREASHSEGGNVPPFDRLIIECDPRNVRSSRLAERAGFVLGSVIEKAFECKGEWVGSMVYSRGLDITT
ncbi:acetyltransferase [Mycena vulgaris]|nr:acetyltransferase [Mycena vulgaris]